jgi:hypothetical protein
MRVLMLLLMSLPNGCRVFIAWRSPLVLNTVEVPTVYVVETEATLSSTFFERPRMHKQAKER